MTARNTTVFKVAEMSNTEARSYEDADYLFRCDEYRGFAAPRLPISMHKENSEQKNLCVLCASVVNMLFV